MCNLRIPQWVLDVYVDLLSVIMVLNNILIRFGCKFLCKSFLSKSSQVIFVHFKSHIIFVQDKSVVNFAEVKARVIIVQIKSSYFCPS